MRRTKAHKADARGPRPKLLHRGIKFVPGNDLDAAIVEECEREMSWSTRRQAETPWNSADTNWIRSAYGDGTPQAMELQAFRQHEKIATGALTELRKALAFAVSAIAARKGRGVGPSGYLLRCLARDVEALFAHPTLKLSEQPQSGVIEWKRTALVLDLDRNDFLGQGRHPTTRELTMLSLLAGNRPSLVVGRAVTVAHVVRLEQRNIDSTRRHLFDMSERAGGGRRPLMDLPPKGRSRVANRTQ